MAYEEYPYLEIIYEDEYEYNHDDTIEQIKKNSKKATYSEVKHFVMNDTCPIELTPFESESNIYYFKPCFHAIKESVFFSFLLHLKKCPLCNKQLI